MPKVELTEEEKKNLLNKKLLFERFVEPGRLCLIEFGPYAGKLCFIVDIVTLTRVIVDGANITGVPRMITPIKRLRLLDQKIKIQRNARPGLIKKAIEESKVLEEFKKSRLGRKMEIKRRRDMANDLERFQVYYAKRQLKRKMNYLANKEKKTKA